MPWYNPYRSQYSNYQERWMPNDLTDVAYGTGDYNTAVQDFFSQLQSGDSDAWSEFTSYIANAMIPYMTGSTAETYAEQLYPSYDTGSWDTTLQNLGGRGHDRYFDSGDRWDAVNQGLTEALNYLTGGNSSNIPSTQENDAFSRNWSWLMNSVRAGQEEGMRGNQVSRTRSQQADYDAAYSGRMTAADNAGVNSGLSSLFSNLWDFDRRSAAPNRQAYTGTSHYRYSPSGSGQSSFYSYGNSRYR